MLYIDFRKTLQIWNAGQWREIQRVALEAKEADGRSSSKLLGSSNVSSRRPSQLRVSMSLNSSRRPSQVFGSKSQFTSHASLGPSSSRTKANREDPAAKRKKDLSKRKL